MAVRCGVSDRLALLPKNLRPKLLAEPLYERRKGESSAAWAAFVAYRDDDEQRSYRKCAEKVGKNSSLIERWGARWRWQERVEVWEKHQDALRIEQGAKDKAEVFEMHGALTKAMAVILGQFLQHLDPMELTPAAAPKWLREIVHAQRLLYGESSETVAVQQSETPEQTADQNLRAARAFCTDLRYRLPTNIASTIIRQMAAAKYDVAEDDLPTIERLDSLLSIRRYMPEVREGKWPA